MPKPKRRFSPVNQQIFVWAGMEPLALKYSGFNFIVPARTETAVSNETDPHSPYKFNSARDAKERRIPGTLLVTDVRRESPNGGLHKVFDVSACCEYLQRDREALFETGFAIVSDVKDIADVMEEIIPLYDASQDRRAHAILQAELERQKKMEEKGQIVTERENPEVVQWALQHMARRGKTVAPAIGATAIEAALRGQYTGPVEPQPTAEPQEEPAPKTEARPSNRNLLQECEQWGMNLTKRELHALVTDDEEQIGFIVEKLRARQEAERASA